MVSTHTGVYGDEMKTCTHCLIAKPDERFSWKDRKRGRRTRECKDCHAVMRRAYYENNRDRELANAKVRKAVRNPALRDALSDLKSTLSCSRCPEADPCTLDFHHVDPAQKDIAVSLMMRRGWAFSRVLKEIEKCIVLCSNCHRKEHAKDRGKCGRGSLADQPPSKRP